MRIPEFPGPSLSRLLRDGQLIVNNPFRQLRIIQVCRPGRADILIGNQAFPPETVISRSKEQNRNPIPVQGCPAGPDAVRNDRVFRRHNGVLNRPPVNGIVADKVSPADIPPIGPDAVALEKQMIHAVIIQRRMRLIHPVLVRSAVVLGFISVTGQNILRSYIRIADRRRFRVRERFNLMHIQRPVEYFQFVHQAAEHPVIPGADLLPVSIFPDKQAFIPCRCNFGACRNIHG